tara:strand:- start:75 stop:341 length:267 start_codon:yes stop_codon:yes gene_type:complete
MVVGFGFTTMLFFAIAFGIMIRTLKRIEKTQTLALAYLINPEATLDGTNSDLVIDNALKQAMTEKGETQRAIKFFKSLKPLIDVYGAH